VERFNLRKISELEIRKQYQVKISNRSAALENVNDSEEINRVWENKENIETLAEEFLKPVCIEAANLRMDKECLRFLDQRKQTKMQWLEVPNHNNIVTSTM
jgi:hypothetical protein